VLWQTSKRKIDLATPVVMGILNVTPDSFSDGGRFASHDMALRRVEEMIAEGAGIIDIGGESTRPGSHRVSETEEIGRTAPVIEAISARFDVPVSIDTSKALVAEAAINAGAEIINDISGLRFDPRLADTAAKRRTGLILMHSRGEFETMHSQPPVDDIFEDVASDFERSVTVAKAAGVEGDRIILDVGIGFGKTLEQNLELIAKLDKLSAVFPEFPLLVGASRKSFIGKVLHRPSADERLFGSLAAAAIAVWNGAAIVRAHDVRGTVDVVRMAEAIREKTGE
jgi:dihydropteroate synthase